MKVESLTFGPVHLDVIDRERSLKFWREVLGLRLRKDGEEELELGTEGETLIVLHPGARTTVRRGFNGLYHVAIHLPNEPEFARVLARLIAARVPVSPTDHVMSKAIYLDDPDGIGIELTLETPERMRSMGIGANGMPEVIDAQGRKRSGRDPIDVKALLATLPDQDIQRPVPEGTKIGHMHLHVSDLDASFKFYRDTLGFLEGMAPSYLGFADLHAGGAFKHRMAINTWQGKGAPKPPEGTAGLRQFTVRYDSVDRLNAALKGGQAEGGNQVLHDPDGNAVHVGVA
jgi:catechol 2,3-dioxygenase